MHVRTDVTMRAAALVLILVFGSALAVEPGLKPPVALPAPAKPSVPAPAEAEVDQYFIVSAETIERVTTVIQAQQREIERLRAIVAKGSCS